MQLRVNPPAPSTPPSLPKSSQPYPPSLVKSTAGEIAHNYKAGGSDISGESSPQFNLDEEEVLYQHLIPVPMEYRLRHGWHMAASSFGWTGEALAH
jgi:hypothetical protein